MATDWEITSNRGITKNRGIIENREIIENKEIIINRIHSCIDEMRSTIINNGEEFYGMPETGFKEFRTSDLTAKRLSEIGLEIKGFGDIPGVKATIDTGRKGPGVAVLGELDAIICSDHPECNRETGAVHACGHNAQLADMIGTAAAILKSGAVSELCGKIHFIAVPAEEYIEFNYRMDLKKRGVIKYLGGKPEILHRGILDDVDICVGIHAAGGKAKLAVEGSNNGCLLKNIRYIGKASHAGGAPHRGINALYAANLGLSAINAIRETFVEEDYIRVHPIITKGGEIVNVIPSDVRIETFIRGKTMEAILEANKKVDRALAGAAISMGAKVEIEDIPGYYPLNVDPRLAGLVSEVAKKLAADDDIRIRGHNTASTDYGDLSAIMPVIQPGVGGVEGALHSAGYKVIDPENLYVTGTKLLTDIVMELLYIDAPKAESILKMFKPVFKNKQEYFDFTDSLYSKKIYQADDQMLFSFINDCSLI